jgi:hypothetical protein
MQHWIPDPLTKRFSRLDGKTDPIFYINVDVNDHYITIIGDARKGRINLGYTHIIDGKVLAAGYVMDRQMQGSQEMLYIDYGSEEDLMPYSDTISIEDALRIAIYFVEHEALTPLPDHLYWNGSGQL